MESCFVYVQNKDYYVSELVIWLFLIYCWADLALVVQREVEG